MEIVTISLMRRAQQRGLPTVEEPEEQSQEEDEGEDPEMRLLVMNLLVNSFSWTCTQGKRPILLGDNRVSRVEGVSLRREDVHHYPREQKWCLSDGPEGGGDHD